MNINQMKPITEPNNAYLAEYHLSTYTSLNYDLTQGQAGFSFELTIALMIKYKTLSWQEAYLKASQYHEKRFNEWAPEGFTSYQSMFYAYENEINKRIDQNLVLGEEPKDVQHS